MDTPDRQPIHGSARLPAPNARDAAALDPNAPVEAVVLLRNAVAGEIGASPADAELVAQALTGLGLQVVSTDLPSRRIRVTGTVAQMAAAFDTKLDQVTSTGPYGRDVTHRHRTGELSLPESLHGIVIAVLGLDDRPQSRAQFRIASASASAISYTPVQVGAIYDFPAGTDGSGQTVAIIELGGGFEQSDLDAYFSGLGLATPSVTAVSVDGATNEGGQDPQGADGEVLLDIEVLGSLAPGAIQQVYFAPNTDAGFLDAVSDAAHASPTPSAISISWGQSEDQWTAQARTALDSVMADAVTLGITVTVAAGDNGSADGETDGKNHADFPASSPNVLACGGTTLRADASTGAVSSETVWNDGSGGGATGGGVSDVFPQPSWQAGVGAPSSGRGVPDVAGDADPETGYQVRVDGSDLVIGGTSAVAPLWAALVARLTQATGKPLGLLNTALYAGVTASQPAPGLRDITSGNNGAFSAGPGWDACTGLGVPNGAQLLTRLSGDTGTSTGAGPAQ